MSLTRGQYKNRCSFSLALYKSCIILLKYFLPKFQIPLSSTSVGISGNYYCGYYEDHMLIMWLISWKSPPSLQFPRHCFVPFLQSWYLHWHRMHLDAVQVHNPCSALLDIHPSILPLSLCGPRNKGGWVFLRNLPTDKADPWFPKPEIFAVPLEFRLCWFPVLWKMTYMPPKGGHWIC